MMLDDFVLDDAVGGAIVEGNEGHFIELGVGEVFLRLIPPAWSPIGGRQNFLMPIGSGSGNELPPKSGPVSRFPCSDRIVFECNLE